MGSISSDSGSVADLLHVREFPVETEHDALQTPDVTHVPDPVHEGQFGPEDHVVHLAFWYKHCCLCIQTDIAAKYSWLEISMVFVQKTEKTYREDR